MLAYIIEKYISPYTISYEAFISVILCIIPVLVLSKKFRKVFYGLLATAFTMFMLLYMNHYQFIILDEVVYKFLIGNVRFGLESLQLITLINNKISLMLGLSKAEVSIIFISCFVGLVITPLLLVKLNEIRGKENYQFKVEYVSNQVKEENQILVNKPILLLTNKMLQ